MRICDPNRMAAFVAPLNAMQFTMYILVPHIACRLIQQDLKCDMDKAYDIMIKSADVGASLHPVNPEDDDDDEFDRLLRANCRAAKNTSYDSDNDDPKATYEIVERAPARVRKAAVGQRCCRSFNADDGNGSSTETEANTLGSDCRL